MTTFTVNNTDDSGLGTLRQAIEDANAKAGLDTIEFDEELSGQEITLTSGELQITDDLTISGLGAEELTVSGNNSSRVFKIDDENNNTRIDVIIDGLTIADGFTDDPNEGSGIENLENLTVTNSTISGNSGWGIQIVGDRDTDGDSVSGIAKITNSNIFGNENGIYIEGGNSASGSVAIINSTISGNGEAIRVAFNGSAFVTDSIISDNTGNGITAQTAGLAGVTNSNISNNGGSGINAGFGQAEVTDSTISDNEDFGMILARSSAEVTSSTVSDNADGGIAVVFTSSVEVDNSTISGNEGSGGISMGINGSANVSNSTITGNTTTGNGGGIYFQEPAVSVNTIIENTIIAGNFDNSPEGSEIEPDVSGIFTSGGYNIIGDGTGSTGFDAPGDQVGTSEAPIDPLLGSLGDNDGSTQTHVLLAGSPAIDAGNPDFVSPPEFDQRGDGFPRVLDGDGDGTATIDIGAFEFSNVTADDSQTVPIIDLTSFTVEVSATSDAGLVNFGGFYQAIDAEGTVIDPITGSEVSVGDEGYETAALANSVVELGDDDDTTLELDGGFAYVPYLLANNTQFFTVYTEANADGLEHVQSIGEDTFGFEDLLGGGDRDFNDYVISFDIV